MKEYKTMKISQEELAAFSEKILLFGKDSGYPIDEFYLLLGLVRDGLQIYLGIETQEIDCDQDDLTH